MNIYKSKSNFHTVSYEEERIIKLCLTLMPKTGLKETDKQYYDLDIHLLKDLLRNFLERSAVGFFWFIPFQLNFNLFALNIAFIGFL
jgi:hypothetical protein